MTDHQAHGADAQAHAPELDERLSMSAVRASIGEVCNRVRYGNRQIGLKWRDDTRVVLVSYQWWQHAARLVAAEAEAHEAGTR